MVLLWGGLWLLIIVCLYVVNVNSINSVLFYVFGSMYFYDFSGGEFFCLLTILRSR